MLLSYLRRSGYSKLILFGMDRLITSVGLVVNSLILANAVGPVTAGVYFFSTSVVQLLVSPWVVALDLAWSGARHGDQRARAIPMFFTESLLLVAVSSVVTLAALYWLDQNIGLFWLVSVPAVLASATAVAQYLPLVIRYDETRTYVAATMAGNLLALVLKLTLVLAGAPGIVILLALFSDLVIVSIVLGFLWLKRVARPPLRLEPISKARLWSLFTAGATIYAVLFGARSLLIFARFAADAHAYAAIGLAMQMINSVMLLSGALVSALRANAGETLTEWSQRRALARRALVVTLVVSLAYVAGIWLLGYPVLSLLMPEYAPILVSLLKHAVPVVPALMMAGAAMAIGPDRQLTVSIGTFGTASAAGIIFLLVPGLTDDKVLAWASMMLAGSALVFWLVGRGGAGSSAERNP